VVGLVTFGNRTISTNWLDETPGFAAPPRGGCALIECSWPSVVPSVIATCMPAWALTDTSLIHNDLTRVKVGSITVARLQFAVAREERDGVDFLAGRVDRLTGRRGKRESGRGRRGPT
jgi:hypothetical protein